MVQTARSIGTYVGWRALQMCMDDARSLLHLPSYDMERASNEGAVSQRMQQESKRVVTIRDVLGEGNPALLAVVARESANDAEGEIGCLPYFLRPTVAQLAAMVAKCFVVRHPRSVLCRKGESVAAALRLVDSGRSDAQWRNVTLSDRMAMVIGEEKNASSLGSGTFSPVLPELTAGEEPGLAGGYGAPLVSRAL
jgi:hypothetical protein